MRVLVVTTWFPSIERPTEAPFNLEHCRAIARRHEVQVVHVELGSSRSAEAERYGGFPVIRIGAATRSPQSLLRTVILLRSQLRDADVLHTMAFSSILVTLAARLLRRRSWVHSEHWSGVREPSSVSRVWRLCAWARYALRFPDQVTAVSGDLASVLRRFARPSAVTVVPCVVENTRALQPREEGTTLRLVAVGGLVPGKQPLLAIDTVAKLKASGHRVHLTWVGGGPLQGEVAGAVASLQLEEEVTLTGPVTPEAVIPLIEKADLFFLPTRGETFFASAAEALSAGRPVVTLDRGGFTDYVDETNSLLVDRSDPTVLADAILRAQDHFRGIDPAVIAAPIRRRFSTETIGDQFDRIYRTLAGRRS